MKVLFVAAGKKCGFAAFVNEQKEAIAQELRKSPMSDEGFGISDERLAMSDEPVMEYAHTAHGIGNYIKEARKLHRTIKELKPDVVHAHFGLTGLMAGLAAIGTGVPVVVTYHGCDINDKKLRPFSRMAMRLAAWNIFVSKRQMINAYGSERKAAKAKKGSIIPCGIDIKLFDEKVVDNTWYDTTFGKGDKVLFGGDFGRGVKNAPLAFAAMALLNENLISQKLPAIGQKLDLEANQKNYKENNEGLSVTDSDSTMLTPQSACMQESRQTDDSSCSTDTDAQSLSDNPSSKIQKIISPDLTQAPKAENGGVELIEMKGFTREQVVTLMYRCKALLLTSIREGSPQVIKEAMACGCPIVSVDVGDVSERLEGLDGCFVVKSREPKELADALEKAIAFGRTKGRERLLADGLDNEQVALRLIEIYKQVQ